jgi:hypothetical protein
MSRIASVIGCLALVISGVALPACASGEESDAEESAQDIVSADLSASTEQSLANRLPTTPALDAWYTAVTELETGLADGDPRFVLEPHRGGGTSAYVEVKRDGETIGAFLPDNSATVPLGEVRAFQLARALGVPSNVGPGMFFRLKGTGLASFKTIMESERYTAAKEENRLKIVSRLASNQLVLLSEGHDLPLGRSLPDLVRLLTHPLASSR